MSDDATRPGERRMNQAVERLMEHLECIEEATHIREHKGTVDFTVGDSELWPSYANDSELNVISSSSISFDALLDKEKGFASQSNPQMGQNIHLPPAEEELWDELQAEADFSDKFKMVNGTFQLGSLMPPPTGICSPHILIVEDAGIDEVIEMVDEVFKLYREVYDSGEKVVKEQPEAENSDN